MNGTKLWIAVYIKTGTSCATYGFTDSVPTQDFLIYRVSQNYMLNWIYFVKLFRELSFTARLRTIFGSRFYTLEKEQFAK